VLVGSRAATLAFARPPIRARCDSLKHHARAMPSARACESPTSARKPELPSSISSSKLAPREATTTLPRAMASMHEFGRLSTSDGSATTRAFCTSG